MGVQHHYRGHLTPFQSPKLAPTGTHAHACLCQQPVRGPRVTGLAEAAQPRALQAIGAQPS
eukprot:14182047-Alexandrium_andersonii.AAC.1